MISIRDGDRIDDPLRLLLPTLPPSHVTNSAQDPLRMAEAFRTDPVYRAALEARGLTMHFDLFDENIDPLTSETLEQERHADMFWHFMALYYQIKRQETVSVLPDIEIDETGIDQFLVRAGEAGGDTEGLKILRAVADTLSDFLGENASVLFARSPYKVVMSSVLREFATNADFEQDTPQRLLQVFVGSVAVAAADHGAQATENPAAALLFGALGRARQEFGDDFVARIASHAGFTAVVSDWVGSLAEDPYLIDLFADLKGLDDGSYDPTDASTLPARLQPVFGALQATIGVIGANIGTAEPLSQEDTFKAVFGSVLTGVTQNSRALLSEKLEGDKFIADLLQAVIATVGQAGAVQSNDLIAPVFKDLMAQMALVVPTIGQADALSRAQVILQDLAQRVTSGETAATLGELEETMGPRFARAFMIELFSVARARTDVLLTGESEEAQAVAEVLFSQMPDFFRTGLDRAGAERLFGAMITEFYASDPDNQAFVGALMPQLAALVQAMGTGRARLNSDMVEEILTLLIARLARDQPIWQKLQNAKHMPVVIEALAEVLRGNALPKTLSIAIVLEIADEAIGVFARHGLKLSDLAMASVDPEVFLSEQVKALTVQAVDAAVGKLGRDAGGDDLARIIGRVLTEALSSSTPHALSATALAAAVDAALAEVI